MQVRAYTVGPILGYVEPRGARIFGRGDYQKVEGGPRRCFGVVRVRAAGGSRFRAPVYSKLMPHFDFTGVLVVGGLRADSEYEYQAGWFYSEREMDDPTGGRRLDWSDIPVRSFRTATGDASAPRSFVFGSCRYLLRLFGGEIFEERGDKTFRSINRQKQAGRGTDALIMVGDQVYADDMNFIAPDQRVDEFLKRYREVFSRPHLGELMSSVPTYMTLDDHEIEDNWPSKADQRDLLTKYPAAIHSYSIYQMSHSPLPFLDDDGKHLAGVPNHFWYAFRDGCCDFFVTDTRTERIPGEEIISQIQMNALKNWLDDGSGRVKVIVTSVPLFPDSRSGADDKWGGFIAQRDELLNFIHDRKVRRVLTLSGDVHASMSVDLESASDPDFRIVSVISSPFYWPYPHPSRRSFQLEGDLNSISPYGFRLRNPGPVVCTENFTRLSVDLKKVKVEVFSRKGEAIGEPRTHRF